MLTAFLLISVVGLSFDYVTYNIIGFVCYSIFNCAFYWVDSVKEEYKDRHHGKANLVAPNDVAFGLHAVFATIIIIFQIIFYEVRKSLIIRIIEYLFENSEWQTI